MCLYTRQVNPKTFARDMTFYKVLYLCGNEYYTPFTIDKVAIGEDICATGAGILYRKDSIKRRNYNLIFSGYIHLLRKKYKAEELKKLLICHAVPTEKMKIDNVVIVRAIVPAGTEYYSGFDDTYSGSVAVKKVKYEQL